MWLTYARTASASDRCLSVFRLKMQLCQAFLFHAYAVDNQEVIFLAMNRPVHRYIYFRFIITLEPWFFNPILWSANARAFLAGEVQVNARCTLNRVSGGLVCLCRQYVSENPHKSRHILDLWEENLDKWHLILGSSWQRVFRIWIPLNREPGTCLYEWSCHPKRHYNMGPTCVVYPTVTIQ